MVLVPVCLAKPARCYGAATAAPSSFFATKTRTKGKSTGNIGPVFIYCAQRTFGWLSFDSICEVKNYGLIVMRRSLQTIIILLFSSTALCAQEDKKTDDLKPADPDTGESTVEETTLGMLPNPFEGRCVKLAVSYIGDSATSKRFTRKRSNQPHA